MINKNRRFSINAVKLDELLAQLHEQPAWTLCSAWVVEHEGRQFVIANDSTYDGGSEYAICRLRSQTDNTVTVQQIESLTVRWIVRNPLTDEREPIDKLRNYFLLAFATPEEGYSREITLRADREGQGHRPRCPHC